MKLDSCGPSHRLAEWSAQLYSAGSSNSPIQIENCHDNTTFPYFANTTAVDGTTVSELQCPMHFFRVSHDINPSWERITGNLQCQIKFNQIKNPIARPGCFGYPDMLEVGNGELTYEQSRSHFGAWIMVSAPLVLGMDMSDLAVMATVWPIITNDEAINISQTYHLHPGFLVNGSYVAAPTPPPTPGPPVEYLVCKPANGSDSTQQGWKKNTDGTIGRHENCIIRLHGGKLELKKCDSTDSNQLWVVEDNGNVHAPQSMSCIAAQDWSGPELVLSDCKQGAGGANEEWFFGDGGAMCFAKSHAHNQRCMAEISHPPPSPTPGGSGTVPSWQVYAKPLPGNKMAAFLFNADTKPQPVSVALASLGFEGSSVAIRDVWAHKDLPASGTIVSATLEAYDSALLILSPIDAKDKTGLHPFSKIDDAVQEQILANEWEGFHSSDTCSYQWV